MKSTNAAFVLDERLMDTLPAAIDSAGRRDRSRRNAMTPLLRRRVTASDCPTRGSQGKPALASASRLAVVIRVVGDVRRGGHGPDRAASYRWQAVSNCGSADVLVRDDRWSSEAGV